MAFRADLFELLSSFAGRMNVAVAIERSTGGSILNFLAEPRLLPDLVMSSEKIGPVRGDEAGRSVEE